MEALAAQAVEMLNPYSTAELLAKFDEAAEPQARAQAVLHVGLAAPPEFDKGVFARIRSALSDPDPRIRYAALWATTYTGYREFVPLIQHVAANDPEGWVRDHARAVLIAYESEG